MKTRPSISNTLAALLSLAACHQALADGTMRDVTTPEQMDVRVRASQVGPQLPGEAVKEGEARVINKVPESIMETSQLLAANGQWTIVPKSAVIFVPPALQAHVVDHPAGTLVSFQEFLTANRQWLSNTEITIEQAAGQSPIKPETAKFWSSQGRVVVATHEGGAISCKATTAPKS